MPQVSIITPTYGRTKFLPAIWNCVRSQLVSDLEWLVLDDSPERAQFDGIADPRVRYIYEPQKMLLGAKRNYLCQEARGEIIALFDDDDFYARHYLKGMLALMHETGAEFVKLFGFFMYHRGCDVFGYWDLERKFPWQYCVSSSGVVPTPNYQHGPDSNLGFGFSYVFQRVVWEAVKFDVPLNNWNEDAPFALAAREQFNVRGMQDTTCSCLHVIQTSNSSKIFPQQLLPRDLLNQLFPDFPG